MVARSLVLLSVFVVACAPAESADDAAASEDAVQSDAVAESTAYSVFIPTNFKTACSGTLIAPNLVLTARHCLVASTMKCGDTFGAPPAASELYVSDRPTPLAYGAYQDVAEIRVPEGNQFCGDDIALLVLEKPYQGERTFATPLLARTAQLDGAREIAAIGYGLTAPKANDAGTRRALEHISIVCVSGDRTRDCTKSKYRSGTTRVAPTELVTAGGVCSGDSGSGAIEQQSYTANAPLVIGVASRVETSGAKCIEARYTRTDAHAAFLIDGAKAAARRGGYPLPAWAQ